MTESKKKRIAELIDAILNNIANRDISTESLLYQTKELATLVGTNKDDTRWMDHELGGYPRKGEMVPDYRIVDIVASVPSPEGFRPFDADWDYRHSMVGNVKNFTYGIRLSIVQLEQADKPIIYTNTETHQAPKRRDDTSRYENPTIDVQILFHSTLTIKRMHGIVASVRKRIHDFVLEHRDLTFDDSSDEVIIHKDDLLDSKVYENLTPTDDFLLHVNEINKCYKTGAYTAAGILSRKLIENLLYYVMERAYKEKPEKRKKIYNEYENRIEGFRKLIIIFDANFNDDFRKYCGITKKPGIEKQIQILNEIKDDLDMATHNLPIILDEKDVMRILPKIISASKFLRRIHDSMP